MMNTKTFTLIFLTVLLATSLVSAGTYTETFENADPELPGAYNDGFFVGDNEGITWTYVEAYNEEEYVISGNGLMLRDLSSKIYSNTISEGIGSFSVDLKKGFTGDGNRQVELFINSVSKGVSTIFDDIATHTFTIDNINVEGDIIIDIRNIQDNQIVIDNIVWTDYTPEVNFCELIENPGQLIVSIEAIEVTEGFGDDEEYWYPFDEVEVEVEVEIDGAWDIDEIEIEWGLYDSDNPNDWVIKLNDEEKFNLNEDDDGKTIMIEFKLEKEDLDVKLKDLPEEVLLVVRVTGDIDDNKAGSYDDTETCHYATDEIEIVNDDEFVILDNIRITPETAECDMDVQITADIWNIKNEDQDDVYIKIFNADLKLDETIEIGEIKDYDNEELPLFNFIIPADAIETSYEIEFSVYDDDEIYENSKEDDKAIFTEYIAVEGNCKVAPEASVSAILDSDAKSGKELVVKSTVTNDADEEVTYTLQATGYEAWANLKDVNPAILVLGAGESAEVIYKLNVNADASGAKTFDIVVRTGDTEKETMKQPVSVTISESTGFSFPGFTGAAVGEGNWYLWGIGLLNVILIIIIIIVAIRVAKS